MQHVPTDDLVVQGAGITEWHFGTWPITTEHQLACWTLVACVVGKRILERGVGLGGGRA